MKPGTKIAMVMLALALALVSMLTLARPRASASGVSVAFLGYTNSAQGSRFGLFGITNEDFLSRRSILIQLFKQSAAGQLLVEKNSLPRTSRCDSASRFSRLLFRISLSLWPRR